MWLCLRPAAPSGLMKKKKKSLLFITLKVIVDFAACVKALRKFSLLNPWLKKLCYATFVSSWLRHADMFQVSFYVFTVIRCSLSFWQHGFELCNNRVCVINLQHKATLYVLWCSIWHIALLLSLSRSCCFVTVNQLSVSGEPPLKHGVHANQLGPSYLVVQLWDASGWHYVSQALLAFSVIKANTCAPFSH